MISVILIEPQTEGNVGAIARVMKNFELKELILVNPQCNHLGLDAVSRAKHGKDILKKAKVKKVNYLKSFDYLIGTTAMLGTDYNIPRSPITPEQMAGRLPKKGKNGIVFGRESSGLTNKEVQMCDFVVTIPCSKKYPTLNLSHAATILFYELFKVGEGEKVGEHITMASKKEKEVILSSVDDVLNKLDFQTKEKKDTQKIIWKRIVGKSFLTKREAFALIGFFKKVGKK
ncbi:MAG: RNA methyltransferase [Candidatus Woesearchaeota archaeon]|jgi:TrmH family RNA methyltransferase|nr:RNA methyltransferase [Candidatus Woesearchaeota archaeon]